MTRNNFKFKAYIGFILLLFFPLGFVTNFTEYTNSTIIFLLAIIIGFASIFLTLPYIKTIFKLDEKENYDEYYMNYKNKKTA